MQRYRAILASFSLNRTGQYIAPVFPASLTFPGFTKADLFVSYERPFTDRLVMKIFGGAENIFNRKYFENGFRAPRILGRGGITFQF
jgi:outer membrane receptor protein involved in Fe transport